MEKNPNVFLRRARMDTGLTQEEVAEELDVSSMTIYRSESGQSTPSQFQRLRLCALFSKSEQELGLSDLEEEPIAIGGSTLFDPTVPVRRSTLVGQHSLLKTLQARYLAPPVGRRIIGLVGMPGCGKTAVATALLVMPKIQQLFTGVLWATVGQVSTPRRHLQRWANLLGLATLPEDLEQSLEMLRMAIGTRRMLIVLDDLWDLKELASYHIGAPCCHYLLTTRQLSLAYQVCDAVYRPMPLTAIQAFHFLSSALPSFYVREYRSALQTITVQVGNLPLALELARNYLRSEASTDSRRRIQAAISQLASPSWYLHHQGIAERESVCAALQQSEQWLPDRVRKALVCLATSFPAAPGAFCESQALEMLHSQDLQAQDLDRLLDAGLLDALGGSRYQLHPLLVAYVRLRNAASLEDISTTSQNVAPCF